MSVTTRLIGICSWSVCFASAKNVPSLIKGDITFSCLSLIHLSDLSGMPLIKWKYGKPSRKCSKLHAACCMQSVTAASYTFIHPLLDLTISFSLHWDAETWILPSFNVGWWHVSWVMRAFLNRNLVVTLRAGVLQSVRTSMWTQPRILYLHANRHKAAIHQDHWFYRYWASSECHCNMWQQVLYRSSVCLCKNSLLMKTACFSLAKRVLRDRLTHCCVFFHEMEWQKQKYAVE